MKTYLLSSDRILTGTYKYWILKQEIDKSKVFLGNSSVYVIAFSRHYTTDFLHPIL